MKIQYFIGIIMILVLGIIASGCAPQQQTETVSDVPGEDSEEVPDQPETEAGAIGEVEVPEEESEIADETGFKPASGTSVQMLGKEGFDPAELTIAVGTTVEFVNTLEKDDTLVFKRKGIVGMDNTPIIEPGTTFEKTFDEAGEYEFWAVGYGPVGAKIVVE